MPPRWGWGKSTSTWSGDNHGARRLYRRRGFGVLAEQGARLLLGKKL